MWYTKTTINKLKYNAKIIFEYINHSDIFTDIAEYDFSIVDHIKYDGQLKKNEAICGVINYPQKKIEIAIIHHENLAQLIDTIAHEIAHVYYYSHGRENTKFKMLIKKCIKEWLKYTKIYDKGE